MAKWEQLITARERKHLSQAEAAERANVGLVTYQRWELGKRRPQPQHMRHLCEIFDTLLEFEEAANIQKQRRNLFPLTSTTGTSLVEAPNDGYTDEINELQIILATNMTSRLWSLALMDHPTCHEKRAVIRQTIKEFDSMNTENKNYHITRREALCSLATLPLVTLGLTTPGNPVRATQYKSVLDHCAASFEACWELRMSKNASDLHLASTCATKYLATLKTIAQNSSQYRQESLDLAARYSMLKAFFARECSDFTDAVQCGKDAVVLSKETGDLTLQIIATQSLAWASFYAKNYTLALSAAQNAEALLLQYTRFSTMEPFYPSLQGMTYSTLALMQIKNRQSIDTSLGKAMALDPGDGENGDSFTSFGFKRSTLLLDAGIIYCYQGDQTKAMQALEQRVDPDTLMPRITQSEIGRVETINFMTLSALKARDRDMEKAIHFWQAGIEGAKKLRSEQRFNEALANYELMEAIWSGEPRIASLHDQIVHWEE